MEKETFKLGSKAKDGYVHLTTEQSALIRAEFTPEGKKFFGDLYDALHKDTFGDCAKMSKKVVTNSRLGSK